jgi:hypothetical protein
MLRSLFLVQELGVREKLADSMVEESFTLKEKRNSSVCLESIINNTTLFSEVTSHLHEFAELEGPGVETIAHEEGVHARNHKLGLSVSS